MRFPVIPCGSPPQSSLAYATLMGCLFLVIQKVKLKEQIVSDGGSTHGFYFIFFVVISILYIFLQ